MDAEIPLLAGPEIHIRGFACTPHLFQLIDVETDEVRRLRFVIELIQLDPVLFGDTFAHCLDLTHRSLPY